MPTARADVSEMTLRGLSELPRVAPWIRAWARRNGVPVETADRFDLCSTELVSNIVSHAYGDGAGCRITLRLCRERDGASLEIEDDGMAFNPLEVETRPPATTLEDVRVGGWGIPIVRRFSDGLHYRRAEGRNRIKVIQRCPGPAPP
jgi:anti-sigma regulatory factor (Ser/Thr protein kinase)